MRYISMVIRWKDITIHRRYTLCRPPDKMGFNYSLSLFLLFCFFQMRQAIVSVYITGYSISLIALVVSLAILCGFR